MINFCLREFTRNLSQLEKEEVFSSSSLLENLIKLVQVLQWLRLSSGYCIVINSWYRNKAHNERVKGSSTSQHLKGEAVDVVSPIGNDAFVDLIRKYNERNPLVLGQVIVYPTFVHIALANEKYKSLKLFRYEKGNFKNFD